MIIRIQGFVPSLFQHLPDQTTIIFALKLGNPTFNILTD